MRSSFPPRNTLIRHRLLCACMMFLWMLACGDESTPVSNHVDTNTSVSPTEPSFPTETPSEASTTSPIDFATYLPSQQTLGLFSIRHMGSLLEWMHPDFAAIQRLEETQPFLDWMRSTYGIASLDNDAFASTGLSLNQPWTLAILGFSHVQLNKPDLQLAFILPVDDIEKSTAYLTERWSSNQLNVEPDLFSNHTGWTADSLNLSVAVVEQNLIGCIGLTAPEISNTDSRQCLQKLLSLTDSEQLFHDPSFSEVMQLTNPQWEALLFGNIGWVDPTQMEWTEEHEESFLPLLQSVLERIPAGTVSLVTAPHEISIQTRILVDSEISHEFSLKGADDLSQRIPGHPLAIGRTSLKLLPAWQVFQNWEPTEPELNIYSNMAFFAGLDLESDLLDNFVGHFSVVMAAEEPTHRSPLNWMFYAPVKDLQLTQESLKKVHQLAQQENFGHIEIQSTGTAPIYVLNDQPNTNECIAISAMHRHLVVVQSPVNRCAETMQRIDQGGSSFTEHLDDTVKNQFKSGVPTYAHVDVDHLLDWMATEDDSMAFAPWRALLASIELSAWSVPGYHGHDWVLIPPKRDIHSAVGQWLQTLHQGPNLEALPASPAE